MFDPSNRYDVNQALAHPYMSVLHCPDDEPISPPLPKLAFDFERRFFPIETLRGECKYSFS